GPEHQQGVVDAVLGQDQDGPLGREISCEQGRGDRRRKGIHLGISEPAKAAAGGPFGEKQAGGGQGSPRLKRLPRQRGGGQKWVGGAEEHAAAGERGGDGFGVGKADRGERRLGHRQLSFGPSL